MQISKNIALLRELNGLTQSELADKLGVAQSAVSSWESGAKQPRYPKIERMAVIFSVPIADILGLAEEEEGDLDKQLEAAGEAALLRVKDSMPTKEWEETADRICRSFLGYLMEEMQNE